MLPEAGGIVKDLYASQTYVCVSHYVYVWIYVYVYVSLRIQS